MKNGSSRKGDAVKSVKDWLLYLYILDRDGWLNRKMELAKKTESC
jgi:hypothetical protein